MVALNNAIAGTDSSVRSSVRTSLARIARNGLTEAASAAAGFGFVLSDSAS